jgi:hypothetical protein
MRGLLLKSGLRSPLGLQRQDNFLVDELFTDLLLFNGASHALKRSIF